jgi:hypothetical protein
MDLTQILQCTKDFIAAIKAGDLPTALEHGGHLLTAAGVILRSLIGPQPAPLVGANDKAELVALETDLRALSTSQLKGATFDPALIMVIVQAVLALIEALRKKT